MKIALCLSGQMRTFDYDIVLSHHNQMIEHFNCDVFISTWSDRGISVWDEHAYKNKKNEHENFKSKQIDYNSFCDKIYNIKGYCIDEYDKFIDVYVKNDNIKNLLLSDCDTIIHSKVTSYPELYKRFLCNKLKTNFEIANNFKYDVVICSRPDMLHYNLDFQKHFFDINDKVYHINSGKLYYPNRLYSMFYFSDSKNIDILCDAWNNYFNLVNNNFNNGLQKLDTPRLLYIQAMLNNLQIVPVDTIVGEAFRFDDEFQNWKRGYLDE